jgi:hypothetical protein
MGRLSVLSFLQERTLLHSIMAMEILADTGLACELITGPAPHYGK